MVDLKSGTGPLVAFLIGAISPFLPSFGGFPFIAMGAATISAIAIPSKSKGNIILSMLVWVLSFALFSSIFAPAGVA